MAIVKLPSGKTAKIPNGLSETEALEFIFEKLPDGDDKTAIGDKLNTSGWGAAIGEVAGGVGGAVLGSFAGPLGTVGGGVAGSGAGAALGEQVEQWLTGKGELEDVGYAGAEGAAWGLVPGVGGAAVKQVGKYGVKKLGQAAAGTAATTAAGAGIGATGANVTGVGDPTTAAIIGGVGGALGGHKLASQFLNKIGAGDVIKKRAGEIFQTAKRQMTGRDVPFTDAVTGGLKDMAIGAIRGKIGYKTGAFQTAKGALDVKRAVYKFVFDKAKDTFGTLTSKQGDQLARVADDVVKQLKTDWDKEAAERVARATLSPKEFAKQFPQSAGKPKGQIITHKGVQILEDTQGNFYNPKTGLSVEQFNKGGLVKPMYRAEGGRTGPSGLTAADTEGKSNFPNITVKDVLEFLPGVGDIITAKEIYDEFRKPNPNWLLIGALGGAAVIGLVPGLGDAASIAIKKGARKAIGVSDQMMDVLRHKYAVKQGGEKAESSFDRIQRKYKPELSNDDLEKSVAAWTKGSDRNSLPEQVRPLFDEVKRDLDAFEKQGGTVSVIKKSDELEKGFAGRVGLYPTGRIRDITVPSVVDERTLATNLHELGHASSPRGTSLEDTDFFNNEYYATRYADRQLDRVGGLSDAGTQGTKKEVDNALSGYVDTLRRTPEGKHGIQGYSNRPGLSPQTLDDDALKWLNENARYMSPADKASIKDRIIAEQGEDYFNMIFEGRLDNDFAPMLTGGRFNKGGKVKETLGNKIGILKNEGYPTKQAVAIAYDMRRRGELR